MTDLARVVQQFFQKHGPFSRPFLLALSGGADSLSLFHCLLACQKRNGLQFHVAHVDHGWRPESSFEALQLEKMVKEHFIPFYHKRLDPSSLQGNLEAACRHERYQFFKQICETHHLEGVIIGHQADDQAETVLKRLLEGAHWSKLPSLTSISSIEELQIFRPLLSVSKKEIYEWLNKQEIVPFEDSTNHDCRFLRARMRHAILPLLAQEFRKEVTLPLRALSEDMQEIRAYFDEHLTPLFNQSLRGPWGLYFDFRNFSLKPLEIKYLIRKFCEREGFLLSRPALGQAVQLIEKGMANRSLEGSGRVIWIDRQKIFIPNPRLKAFSGTIDLAPGDFRVGEWHVKVVALEEVLSPFATSWKEGWVEGFTALLPRGDYRLATACSKAPYYFKRISINDWWANHKVPVFLRSIFPVIWKEKVIYHEFLTGSPCLETSDHKNWMVVKLYFSLNSRGEEREQEGDDPPR